MSSEKFCLKWNDFEANISTAFREIRDDKDFFDVTLACENDEQISAHKVILSACSPFFRNILRRNQHQHPLLYLKGVKYSELLSVLNFMYHGEVNVAQEELNDFLSIAEELRVKGLTQGSGGGQQGTKRPKSPPSSSKPIVPSAKRPRPPDPIKQPQISAPVDVDDDIQEVLPVKTEPGASSSMASPAGHLVQAQGGHLATYDEEGYGEYSQFEEQQEFDGSMVDFNQTGVDGNKDAIVAAIDEQIQMSMVLTPEGDWSCSVCGKKTKSKRDLFRHIESLHVENHPGYPCDICGLVKKSSQALRMHVKQTHKSLV